MLQNRSNHFFDWGGFTLAIKLIAVCVIVWNVGHFGLSYAQSNDISIQPSFIAKEISVKIPTLLSTSTPKRVIQSLTTADVIPLAGKFIVADLSSMTLTLYQDGTSTSTYPIQTKGKTGTPWETPAGFYNIQSKEKSHLSTIGNVYMPYSMQFYGNYFIHGWPHYADGTPVSSNFSGGCIRLNTADAEQVFAFADNGTNMFVYDPSDTVSSANVVLGEINTPVVSADSYLVADVDSGDVYIEYNAQQILPIASVSKLITALVANETISFDKKITTPEKYMAQKANTHDTKSKQFVVSDLLYPLLMESSNGVAETLAEYYGTDAFVRWMNATARSLNMRSTHFAEPSGLSPDNVSTSDDLFRLAVYLADKKTFIWGITRTPTKRISAVDGAVYSIANFNKFSERNDFIGGKVGYTDEAGHTMVSIFSFSVGSTTRRVAFIVLQSDDSTADTQTLTRWFTKALAQGVTNIGTACASCTQPHTYRKIGQ